MFPQRDQNQQAVKKQAQVKKQMQLLHMLLPEDGEMDLGDNLIGIWHKKLQSAWWLSVRVWLFFWRIEAPNINGKAMPVVLMLTSSMSL